MTMPYRLPPTMASDDQVIHPGSLNPSRGHGAEAVELPPHFGEGRNEAVEIGLGGTLGVVGAELERVALERQVVGDELPAMQHPLEKHGAVARRVAVAGRR